MHQDWIDAASKAGLDESLIPEILEALELDAQHPSSPQIDCFCQVANMVREEEVSVSVAAGRVLSTFKQNQLETVSMASRDSIKELYPSLEEEQINIGLEVLGIPSDKPTFTAAKLEEFKELRAFIEAGELDSWDEIREHWQQMKSEQQPESAESSEAITVSQSGVIAAPTTIPEEMQDSLAAPIIEKIEQDIEDVPGKMALAQQSAQSDVMDGLEGFVKNTYFQGMRERIQTPEFAERVREALRTGKSPNSSKS